MAGREATSLAISNPEFCSPHLQPNLEVSEVSDRADRCSELSRFMLRVTITSNRALIREATPRSCLFQLAVRAKSTEIRP